ncbi:tyrosine-type recombinase/integrase [Massilia haematophila]|uniref:Tyrosine-type recombinase/integrase n=1 Tax=Massilia haematophila TaxID=457923 RepID=A0ABV7PEC8_9BURK
MAKYFLHITIYRAEPLPKSLSCRPEYAHQLPPGFWFLVDDDNQVVVEPALLFLIDRFIKQGRYKGKHTHKAMAYDLADWWQYLVERGISWADAETDLLVEYRESRLATISRQTHETLKASTVNRRLSAVLAFYRWAHGRNLFYHSTLDELEVRTRMREIDSDPLSHTRSGVFHQTVSTLMAEDDADGRVSVRVINANGHWKLLQSELGPLPTEQSADDPRPSRDRLAAELSFWTGLRVDEVAKLSTLQILNLLPADDALPHEMLAVVVTKTKRLKARTVFVPVYLIRELLHYIEHERKEGLTAGAKHRVKKHNLLFVNSASANHHAGKPVHPDTFDRKFRAAVLRAGLVQHVEKTDPDTRQMYLTRDVRYTFHDLRHSFAIYLYLSLEAAGNAAPWLEVSQRLGHSYLKTTTDIYLAHLEVNRRAINAEVYAATRSRWSGD